MCGLYLARHLSQLPSDHRVLQQLLPEGGALAGVVPGLFKQAAAEPVGLDHEAPALVVEVLHDDPEAFVLLADEVGTRNAHVVELDEGRAAGPDSLAVHSLRGNPLPFLHQEHRNATHALVTSADGHGEVVREDPVCDPLLLAIDDVVVTIAHSGGPNACNVTASSRLCDGQADDLLPHEAPWGNSLLLLLSPKVEHRRQADLQALDQPPQDATTGTPGQLIYENHLMEVVEVLRSLRRHHVVGSGASPDHAGQQPGLVALQVGLLRNGFLDLPLAHIWDDVLIAELAAAGSPDLVRVLVVRAVVCLGVPVWVAKGRAISKVAGRRICCHRSSK
mmetsp:Transcript_47404/g.76820  ORF Transcript_47404/g.76820 Transcript_47404/m.76820 type:complete len:334 (-) Transcript_47404:54-1055(-)